MRILQNAAQEKLSDAAGTTSQLWERRRDPASRMAAPFMSEPGILFLSPLLFFFKLIFIGVWLSYNAALSPLIFPSPQFV